MTIENPNDTTATRVRKVMLLLIIISGSILAVTGGLIFAVNYSLLQNCAVNRVPCPNYSIWVNKGFFALDMGIVILVIGVVLALLITRRR